MWQLQKTNHAGLRGIWELSVLSAQWGRAWVRTKKEKTHVQQVKEYVTDMVFKYQHDQNHLEHMWKKITGFCLYSLWVLFEELCR